MSNYNDGGLSAAAPYYNDWDETKKYLQMLFVPGRNLQARELTQLQTMLQVQIDRFGSHVFKNGSPVAGGMTTISKKINYVRIDPNAATDDVTDYTTLKGELLTESATGVTAKVVHVDATVTDDDPYPVLFVEYNAASTDGLTLTFSNSSALTASGGNSIEVITSAQVTSLGSTLGSTAYSNGNAYLVSVDQGIFFIDGFFAFVDAHSYALVTTTNGVRTYTSTPTARVGLQTTKTTVDIGTDSTLGDPASGSSNKSAPGAHRLKFSLELSQKSFTAGTSTIANTADNGFIELIRLVSGEIRKQIKYPVYSDLENTLARRTYDESGNYTVRAFRGTARQAKYRRTLSIPTLAEGSAFTASETVTATTGSSSSSSGGAQASGTVVSWDATNNLLVVDIVGTTEFVAGDYIVNSDADTGGFITEVTTEHIDLGLEPGKAYIFGREHETVATEYVTVEKPKTYESLTNISTDCEFGNYFVCDTIDGLFDTNLQETIYFYSADNSSSSSSSGSTASIGEARIQSITWDGTSYRVYVFDIQLYTANSIASIANIERIESSTTNAIAYIDDTNGKSSGSTVLYKKEKNSLIFSLGTGQKPIRANSVDNVEYYHRAYFTGTFNGSDNIVINDSDLSNATGDLFYPYSATTVSDLANNRAHFIVVNTTSGTDISANITGVTTTSGGATATISGTTGFSSGDSFAVIATMQSTAQRRTKTLVEDFVIPANISLDGNNIGNLGVADVNAIVTILDTGDSNADVTTKFKLDNGQRDNIYDHAKIQLNTGESVTGPFQVTVDYFVHTGPGPLTVDSYTDGGVAYESIPVYVSQVTGRSYDLKNFVDFRPIRDNQYEASSSSSGGTPTSIDSARLPVPYSATAAERFYELDYDLYQGRTDKLILTKSKEFKAITGNPGTNPKSPADNPDAMTLYVVRIPPYVFDPKNIKFDYVENKRYTMRDIGKLDKRISNLEYYTSLSLLEKDADSLAVRDVNGLDRFKNGILVDAFKGHSVGDVGNPDYVCAIDFRNNILRPSFVSDGIAMSYSSGDSSGVEQVGSLITLTSGSTDPLIEQPLASSAISVNPFNVVSWLGNMILSPESDTWVDVETRPDVMVNLEGDNDAWEFADNAFLEMDGGFGTEWNDWETIWTGVDVLESTSELTGNFGNDTTIDGIFLPHGAPFSVNRETVATNQTQSRTGITTTIEADRVTQSLGDRVVDVSIVPFIRSKVVTATCSGLKPNTILYPFFDGVDVSAHCSPNPIQTDSEGKVTVTFTIPSGTFRTGERLFRITDEENNVVANANVTAEATYFAQGLLQTRENTIVSTRVPRIVRQSVTEERVITDITQREFIETEFDQQWIDPLAQSFLVDGTRYPNGIFLKSADLFFKTKDANLPVQIEIRPSVNGYPHSSKVIPFSTVIKDAGDVNTSESPDPSSSSTYTTFTFDSYVYLAPGEYHLVVRSNSDDYEVWIAEMGQNQIGTTTRITEQPYAGVLFKSQNASTWTADQSKDLTFRLNRCVFSTSTAGTAVFENAVSSSVVDVAQIMASDIQFADAPLTYEYASTPISGSLGSYVTTQANKNIEMTTQMELDTEGDFTVKGNLSTIDAAVSPVIDAERLSLVAVENIINNSTTGETSAIASAAGAKARYITRRVTLNSDMSAEDIRVFLTAYKPVNSDLKVYYRVLASEDETPFEDRPWVEMTATVGTLPNSLNKTDLLELEYKSPNLDNNLDTTVVYDNYTSIQTYAIKIVMLSTNTAHIPYVRDFRAIAVS